MSLTFMQASAQNKINLTEWHINIITFDSMENLLTIACHKASLLVSSLSTMLKGSVIHLKAFFFFGLSDTARSQVTKLLHNY